MVRRRQAASNYSSRGLERRDFLGKRLDPKAREDYHDYHRHSDDGCGDRKGHAPLEKRLVAKIKETFHGFHQQRYPRGDRYEISEEGFLEPKPYTEDVFWFEKGDLNLSEDGTRIEGTAEEWSYSNPFLDDRGLVSDKEKVRYSIGHQIKPVAQYSLKFRFERTELPDGEQWQGSIEIRRSFRGAPEKIEGVFDAEFFMPRTPPKTTKN